MKNSILKYCKDCNLSDTWQRNPSGDVKLTDGGIFEYGYICGKCGHKTILPYLIKELENGN